MDKNLTRAKNPMLNFQAIKNFQKALNDMTNLQIVLNTTKKTYLNQAIKKILGKIFLPKKS